MKIIQIKNVKIGEGIPKICVSLVGKNQEEISEEIKRVKQSKADMAEWRADFLEFPYNRDQILNLLEMIREKLGDIPLIFTFRTKTEGGMKTLDSEEYQELIRKAACKRKADFIDVEMKTVGRSAKGLISFIHDKGGKVIFSSHDFLKTPKKTELIDTFLKMQEYHADIPKIAVMPVTKKDVLTLLLAEEEMKSNYADRPFIAISMGEKGKISRVCGEVFGSCITFGAMNETSAPGQINIEELRKSLQIFHIDKEEV